MRAADDAVEHFFPTMNPTGADHPKLANPKHVSLLPPSLGILYEIMKLPPERFESALSDGTITPDTEQAAVGSLREAIRNEPQQSKWRNILFRFRPRLRLD